MNTTTKQILRTYKSLHLSNIPDDLINDVFCFIGDITETPTMMANKECLHLVKSKSNKSEWFYDGHFCTLCDKYVKLTSRQALKRHIYSQGHQLHLINYLQTNYKLNENNLPQRWMNSIGARYYTEDEKQQMMQDVRFIKRRFRFYQRK